jgi:DNA-binding response OmpR family regulator
MTRILIIDDDAEFRDNLAEILQEAGYEVEWAPTSAEAIKTCARNYFDIILLDFIMPGTYGDIALAELKKVSPGSRIIMITAFATIENAVNAMKRGASDFISKPFKVDELLTVIRRVLEEASLTRNSVDLNLDMILGSLANPIRRHILWAIRNQTRLRLMEITRQLEVEDHTKIIFHLRNLKEAGIIEQDDEKGYSLTPKGRNILDCLGTLEHLAS